MSSKTNETIAKPSEGRRGTITSLLKGNVNVFLINLVCPDNKIITKTHSVSKTVHDVIMDSCKQLEIDRPEIFAIALYEHNEFRFISRKKTLNKFLPSATIISQEQALLLKNVNPESLLNNSIKSCRLYLRVRHFYVSTYEISDKALYFFYQQVRLDALKHQNWLNLPDHTDVFYKIAAKSLWLVYECEASKMIKTDEIPLHYFLPQCEWTDDSMQRIVDELDLIYNDIAEKKSIENEATKEKENSDPIRHVMNTKELIKNRERKTSELPDIKIESDFSLEEYKSNMMRKLITDATKLPFFGMYYYHVTLIQPDDTKSVYCCKLGIGPFGISVTLSTDYTTWLEHASWDWNCVEEVDHDKNILHIHETVFSVESHRLHRFECLDEKEAKYLFKQLRESHLFQIKTMEKIRKRSDTKKRNSIGIISTEIASVALSPFLSKPRSLSNIDKDSWLISSTAHQDLQRTKSS